MNALEFFTLLTGDELIAGATDTCTMAMLLAKLPYNRRGTSCDTESIVRQFIAHENGQPS